MVLSEILRVALPIMRNDLNSSAGSGIKKYKYALFEGLSKSKSVELSVLEYERIGPIGNPLSFMLGNALINYSDFDIVHNTEQGFPSTRSMRRAKLITTVHDLGLILYPHMFVSTTRDYLYSKIEKFSVCAALRSDHIIANSTQTKSEVTAQGYTGQISVIPLGVDEKFKSDLRKTHKDFVVGIVSGLAKRKNISAAIDAFSEVDAKARLEIYGTGQKNDVLMLQEKARTDLRVKLEGFGLPILEAQARGLPVIIYKHAKIPKEVRKHCIEAENNAHVARIIDDLNSQGYKESKRKKATLYARQFGWDKTVADTINVYKKV